MVRGRYTCRLGRVQAGVRLKSVLIIIDGLGDEPIPSLGGKTPLEAAFVPHIQYIASQGRVGRISTVYPGYPIESMVCIMGLLGYEPWLYYPSGRASFEAMAKGIPLRERDLVLRCNTVTVSRDSQTLTDFTAGMITDSDARALISQMELPDPTWELYPGQSYRNTLIIRDVGVSAHAFRCFEPHMHIGESIASLLPQATDPSSVALTEQLRAFLLDTQRQISGLQVPASCRANMLWVWSPSCKPVWPSFHERTGVRAALVGGLDFLHGIAMAAKIHFDVIPGATGYIDTSYESKSHAAVRYINEYEFVLVHVNAADEEAHQHNPDGKRRAIEMVDKHIVGPILNELVSAHGDGYSVAVCGDHATLCRNGKHTDDGVPFAWLSHASAPSGVPRFCEASCAVSEPQAALKFLEDVLWQTVQC